jgi:hypothetical protein
VLGGLQANPSTSTPRFAQQTGPSQSVVWPTLHEEQLYLFHVQLVQELQSGDHNLRRHFRMISIQTVDVPDFLCSVLGTGEATLTGHWHWRTLKILDAIHFKKTLALNCRRLPK